MVKKLELTPELEHTWAVHKKLIKRRQWASFFIAKFKIFFDNIIVISHSYTLLTNSTMIVSSMVEDLISQKLYNMIFSKVNIKDLEEIRLRANCPVVVCVNGTNFVVEDHGEPYITSDDDINYCISRATGNSMYSASEQIRQMYLCYEGGIRIGITGEVVPGANGIGAIKNISSLNIRLPHQIDGFARLAMSFILSGSKVYSTLVVSSAGAGKTTLLRDICKSLSCGSHVFNVLLVDERHELAAMQNGRPTLDVGKWTDVISGGTKKQAFSLGIRSLKPNVIVTDELGGDDDYAACKAARLSGASVIASVHANNQIDLLKNPEIKSLLKDGVFERIIVLSDNVPGRYVGIYDNNLKCIYMPY